MRIWRSFGPLEIVAHKNYGGLALFGFGFWWHHRYGFSILILDRHLGCGR